MRLDLPIQQFFGLGGALRVSWYGDCLPSRDFPMLADWYRRGDLDLDRAVTRVITLDETEPAFEAMERGETLRSVVHLPDNLMCVPFETTSFWRWSSCKDVLARPDESLAKILGIKRDPL